MFNIPSRLASKASKTAAGREWLSALPRVCARLSREWSLQVGAAFDDCHVSLVVGAETADGPAVLKVPMPPAVELGTLTGVARSAEADALRAWSGEGAARLLGHDAATGAMLLERCVPGSTLDVLAPEAGDTAAAEVLSRLHRPLTHPGPFVRLADRARLMADDLPRRFDDLGAPFDHWLVDAAVELLTDLAGRASSEVLLHGDFHHDNVLSAQRQAWLAVDPLPVLGDPAYDAVQYLLFRKGDLADPAAQWPLVITRFCFQLGVDVETVLAWSFVRLVSDAVAAGAEGTAAAELEAWQGDLWSARLVHQLCG